MKMKNEMWLIWKDVQKRRRYKVGILSYQESKYIFLYVNPELDDAKKVGFDFFPGFEDLSKVYESSEMFSSIENRLPNVNRPDYLDILNVYNLNQNSTKWDILVSTKGRLITDNYEFVKPFDYTEVEFDVAGTNYAKDINECKDLLHINGKVFLECENDNTMDSYAIKVMLYHNNKQYHLGYVPRYYSKELAAILNQSISYSALIQNLNFESNFRDEDITVNVKLIFDRSY